MNRKTRLPKKSLNHGLNTRLKWMSDLLRQTHLETPDVRFAVEDFSFPKKSMLNFENDYVFVTDMPKHRVLFERWLRSCKHGFAIKYGFFTVEKFKEVMPERMRAIGDEIGLKFRRLDYNAEDDIMRAVFAK